MPSFAELTPGSTVANRYMVVRLLKAGGQGAVYEVTDRVSERRRALKLLHPEIIKDKDMLARFEREAKVTAKIESEHLVDVFDAGVETQFGSPFLVMEYLVGKDLSHVVEGQGRLTPLLTLTYLQQVALALDKTHAANIVHRDLKAENVFLTQRDDGSPRCKILDFGIAKLMTAQTGGAGSTRVLGTPLFMSPEQLRAEPNIGPETDVYALGHLAFHLLVGRAYFGLESEQMPLAAFLVRVMQGLPERPTDRARRYGVELPAAFDDWMLRVCALDPANRPPAAGIAITLLAGALGAREVGESPRLSRPSENQRQLAAIFETGDPTSASPGTGTLDLARALPAAVPSSQATVALTEMGPAPRDHSTSHLFASVEAPRAAASQPGRTRWVAPVAALTLVGLVAGGLAFRTKGAAPEPSGVALPRGAVSVLVDTSSGRQPLREEAPATTATAAELVTSSAGKLEPTTRAASSSTPPKVTAPRPGSQPSATASPAAPPPSVVAPPLPPTTSRPTMD